MAGIDVSGFDVPAYQQQDNKGLDQLVALTERGRERNAALQQRQSEFAEREKDRQNANEYRLANMISSGTDLSPHLTGDQIANNFATQELQKALPEFSAMAKSGVSPIDLQAAINNKMSMLTPALDNIKQEYSQGDAAAKKMAALHPNFNTEQFLNDYRNDVHSRTVDDKGQLIPTQLVKQSQFQNQLTNPDLMSKYVSGAGGIIKAINDPKNHEEVSAFVGTPDSHMKYDAKKGYWQQENYAPTDVQNGFLKNGTQPHLQVKSEILPMNQLPPEVNQNKPFKLLDKGAYNTFIQEPNVDLELRQLTRQQYPQYDKFNEQEKEYARRNMAYNMLTNLTQHDFHEGAFTKASPTRISINNSNPDQYSGIVSEHFDDARNNNPHTVYNSNTKSNETWGKLPLDLGAKTMAYNALTGQNTPVPYDAYYVTPTNKVIGVTYPRDKKTNKPIEGSTFDKQDVLPVKDYASKLLQQRGVPQKARVGATDLNVKELGGNSGGGKKSEADEFNLNIPKKAQGMQPNNIADDDWKLHEDIQGKSHEDDGENKIVNGELVNTEGKELILKNSAGQKAIIPKKDRETMLSMIKNKAKSTINKYILGLPKNPPKADKGGMYDEDSDPNDADDKNKVVPPANYKPLTVQNRSDWNEFLDYLAKNKVAGSKDLDARDNTMGLNYLTQYQKENPKTTVTPEIIPAVQYEQNQLRKGTQFGNFTPQELKEWQSKNADFVNKPVSPVDNWLGSITSKLYYPQASQVFTNSEGKEIKPPVNFGTDIEAYHRAVKKVDATAKK